MPSYGERRRRGGHLSQFRARSLSESRGAIQETKKIKKYCIDSIFVG